MRALAETGVTQSEAIQTNETNPIPMVGSEELAVSRRLTVSTHAYQLSMAKVITPRIASAIEQKLHNNSEASWRFLLGNGRPKSAYYTMLYEELIIEWGEIDPNGNIKLHNYLNRIIDHDTRLKKGAIIRSGHIAELKLPDPNDPGHKFLQKVALFDSLCHGVNINPESPEYNMVITLWQHRIMPLSTDGFPAII